MKKIYLILLAALLVLVVTYLYFSYSRIYNFVQDKSLSTPFIQTNFTLNSNQSGQIKYVALGDSLSAGLGSTDSQKTLVYQVAQKLASQSAQVQVINLSYSGATIDDLIQDQLDRAIQEQPDVITILIGTNDVHAKKSPDVFMVQLQMVLDKLTSQTKAKIIVINIPYLGSEKLILPPYNSIIDMRIRQYNKGIAKIAVGQRIKLVDLYGLSYQKFAQNPDLYYSKDQFHPSGEGYLLWGEFINAD